MQWDSPGRVDLLFDPPLFKEVIVTVLITVLAEGGIILGYAAWRKKPFKPLLLTGLVGNLLTQSLLWIAVRLFFQYYLIILLGAELSIWVIEGLLLYAIPANKLRLSEAFSLSLAMNLASLMLGWLLPV